MSSWSSSFHRDEAEIHKLGVTILCVANLLLFASLLLSVVICCLVARGKLRIPSITRSQHNNSTTINTQVTTPRSMGFEFLKMTPSLTDIWINLNSVFQIRLIRQQEESIPVGCVPPSFLVPGALPNPPWMQTPSPSLGTSPSLDAESPLPQ